LHGIMALADIYLDSYPFAGACSLLDPLLVGLPLVARSGRSFRSGVGAGMLRGLGIGDMAVADEEAYVARAVGLAKSVDLRRRERARIQAALLPRNPVFDSETASRNMEAAFVDMAARADALDAELLRQPAARLLSGVEKLAARLALDGNPWYRALNDAELIRQLVVPYFQSLSDDGQTRRMLEADFEALRRHDFSAAPPRLAMVRLGTDFAQQSRDAVVQGIAEMAQKGYHALVFSHREDGQAGGTILFFRPHDTIFLAVVLRALLGFLPPRERQRHYLRYLTAQ
jgi:hypothetical protein